MNEENKKIYGRSIRHSIDGKMQVEIEFTFNASELAGKEPVTFEELYDVTIPTILSRWLNTKT